ncbi:IS630 family transposase [Chroococcidiopsis cubana]|uniref:IS630 family transposase n=1 Tax=Chroococcidiopsis cubana TaxID=171392 RepID=UPI001F547E36|nr:IS630 family transposase [Chroococcidiopsis cubana]
MKQQKTATGKERVQALYLLKTKQVETVQHLAVVLGRNRVTVQRWLSRYRQGGLNYLLEVGKSTGRTPLIPSEVVERLKQELLEPEGFSSYEEVRLWLAAELGVQVKYDVVHNLVHDKLKADLKVARPKSSEQEPGVVESFKKELPQKLLSVIEEAEKQSKKFKSVRYWCEDETRLGWKTVQRRKLTSRGVKPIGTLQFRREKYYMYGVVEPLTGENFFRELSHLDTECFPEFLNEFSETYPEELQIIQLDNGSFHTTPKLKAPENIILLFQPAHCPELNPIERLWEHLKGFLSWEIFNNLNSLKAKIRRILNSFSEKILKDLTGWRYILTSLEVANI